ncbi:hypothetical protein TNCV_4233631 [Trichonephila clavipes]|nr:hypothetical protein TNCV_4233631 [Trichonephila clavipes]
MGCVFQYPSMQFGTKSCWVITSFRLCCSLILTVMEFSSKTTVLLTNPSWLLAGWMSIPLTRRLDLNPVKHLCDVLEQGVKGHHTAPTIRT